MKIEFEDDQLDQFDNLSGIDQAEVFRAMEYLDQQTDKVEVNTPYNGTLRFKVEVKGDTVHVKNFKQL